MFDLERYVRLNLTRPSGLWPTGFERVSARSIGYKPAPAHTTVVRYGHVYAATVGPAKAWRARGLGARGRGVRGLPVARAARGRGHGGARAASERPAGCLVAGRGECTLGTLRIFSRSAQHPWRAQKGSFDPLLAVYGLTAGLGLLGIRRFVTGPMKTMRAIKPDTMNAMVWAGLGLSLWQRVQLYRLKKHYWEESQDTSTEFAARRIFRLTTLSVLCEDREPDSVGRQLFRELSEKLYREHQQTLDDPASLGWLDRRLAERNVLSLRDGQSKFASHIKTVTSLLTGGCDYCHNFQRWATGCTMQHVCCYRASTRATGRCGTFSTSLVLYAFTGATACAPATSPTTWSGSPHT